MASALGTSYEPRPNLRADMDSGELAAPIQNEHFSQNGYGEIIRGSVGLVRKSVDGFFQKEFKVTYERKKYTKSYGNTDADILRTDTYPAQGAALDLSDSVAGAFPTTGNVNDAPLNLHVETGMRGGRTNLEFPYPPNTTSTDTAGFDTSTYPGDSTMSWLKTHTNLQWVGYYLAPAPSRTNATWMGSYARQGGLRDQGWGVAPLYVGEQG